MTLISYDRDNFLFHLLLLFFANLSFIIHLGMKDFSVLNKTSQFYSLQHVLMNDFLKIFILFISERNKYATVFVHAYISTYD